MNSAIAILKEEAEALRRICQDDPKGFTPYFAKAFECDEAIKILESHEEKCVWTENEDGYWETGCNEAFCVENGTPKENKMFYCHNCGKRVKEVAHVEPPMEEEEA